MARVSITQATWWSPAKSLSGRCLVANKCFQMGYLSCSAEAQKTGKGMDWKHSGLPLKLECSRQKSSWLPFENGRDPAAPSAQNWQKSVRPRYTCLQFREVCSKGPFMEDLWPEEQFLSYCCTYFWKHKNYDTEKMPSQKMFWNDEPKCKIFGSLSAEGLEGSKIKDVCRQLWDSLHDRTFSGLVNPKLTGKFLSITQYHQGHIRPGTNSFCSMTTA